MMTVSMGLLTVTWPTSSAGVVSRPRSSIAYSATERQPPMSTYDGTLLCASWLPTSAEPVSVPPARGLHDAARTGRVDPRLQRAPAEGDRGAEDGEQDDAEPVRAQNAEVVAQLHGKVPVRSLVHYRLWPKEC